MRRMASAFINGADGLFVSACRMANACQNTQLHNLCQEMPSLIFFWCVINDAHPAAPHGRQFLHLCRIGWADSRLVLRALLRPANKWTFQAYAQNLSGWNMPLAFGGISDPAHLLYRLRPLSRRDGGKE